MTTAGAARPGWARTAATSLVVGLATSGSIFAGMVALAPAASAADDSSAVTVTAAEQDPDLATAPFPDLSVTVSQTKNLVSQGITLTYDGGTKSTAPSGQTAGSDFLQVFQCWGDLKDPTTGQYVLDGRGHRQPDRTTCQYGASGAWGQSRTNTISDPSVVAPEDQQYLYRGTSFFDPSIVSIPFASVTGTTLANIKDGQKVPGALFSSGAENNQFFTTNTTNEVSWAGFTGDGTGGTPFEVQTNMQAPGLGCGNPVTTDGVVEGQSCWLVILPRGTADPGEQAVTKTGLLWQTWQHRLAVQLEFRPLGVRCAIGAAERAAAGSELVAQAFASWQPELCAAEGGAIYNLIVANEADVIAQANGTDVVPLALTSRALAADEGTLDSLTYAPIALTGLTVAFAVDHQADVLAKDVPQEVKDLDRQPFTQMNLTPRLLAKLLTYSYAGSLPVGSEAPYLAKNPQNITKDPDFLAVNPGWAYQSLTSPAISDALTPLGRSDSAVAVWNYVLADADARAFLAGTPDPWGMVVNPWATTDTQLRSTVAPPGDAATYPVDSFPKVDPSEVDQYHDPFGRSVVNVVTWRPYAPDLDTAGYWVLRGDGRVLGAWDPAANPPKFGASQRQISGYQAVIGLTDTASAAKYEVFTAALRNPAGQFVLPTTDSMTAAATAMTPDPEQPQVLRFDGTSDAAVAATDAYPLTVPVYAATNATGGDAASREAYANLIRYAADEGQDPGTDLGQLPPGYAPLPAAWKAQADAAAATISAQPAPPTTPTESPTASSSPVPTEFPTSPASVGEAPSSELPGTGEPPNGTVETGSAGTPTPTPSPTGTGPQVVVGAATPADMARPGPASAAVPISAAGGLLAAAAVPVLTRPRRAP